MPRIEDIIEYTAADISAMSANDFQELHTYLTNDIFPNLHNPEVVDPIHVNTIYSVITWVGNRQSGIPVEAQEIAAQRFAFTDESTYERFQNDFNDRLHLSSGFSSGDGRTTQERNNESGNNTWNYGESSNSQWYYGESTGTQWGYGNIENNNPTLNEARAWTRRSPSNSSSEASSPAQSPPSSPAPQSYSYYNDNYHYGYRGR